MRLLCPRNFPGKNAGVVAISFSRGSSRPRDQTHVSCIGMQILYHCATWEAPLPPDLRTCKNQHWYLEPFSPQALMSVQFTLLCSKWFIPQVTHSHEIWITMSFYSTCGGGLVTKSCLTLATPWTVARQTPLSMGFLRQEYWSGLSFPSLGVIPDPGIKPVSPALAGRFFTTEQPRKPKICCK